MSYTKAQREAKKNEKWLIPLTITGTTFYLMGYAVALAWGVKNAYFTHAWGDSVPYLALMQLFIGLACFYIGQNIQNKQRMLLASLKKH